MPRMTAGLCHVPGSSGLWPLDPGLSHAPRRYGPHPWPEPSSAAPAPIIQLPAASPATVPFWCSVPECKSLHSSTAGCRVKHSILCRRTFWGKLPRAGGLGGRGVIRGHQGPPPESLRRRLLARKPTKNHGNVDISKNVKKKT